MAHGWRADPTAAFEQRLGKSAKELNKSENDDDCPDIWRLTNGDIAVIGADLTDAYASCLPSGVTMAPHERLVVIPGIMLSTAKEDIPDV